MPYVCSVRTHAHACQALCHRLARVVVSASVSSPTFPRRRWFYRLTTSARGCPPARQATPMRRLRSSPAPRLTGQQLTASLAMAHRDWQACKCVLYLPNPDLAKCALRAFPAEFACLRHCTFCVAHGQASMHLHANGHMSKLLFEIGGNTWAFSALAC